VCRGADQTKVARALWKPKLQEHKVVETDSKRESKRISVALFCVALRCVALVGLLLSCCGGRILVSKCELGLTRSMQGSRQCVRELAEQKYLVG